MFKGNYHMKTSDFDSMVGDIKAHLAKEAAGDNGETAITLDDVVGELKNLSGVINVIKTKSPKWFK